jgi:Domain of unknown function (DUF3806)
VRRWSRRESDVQERVEQLSDGERSWIAENVSAARDIARQAGLEREGQVTEETLDDLWVLLRSELANDPNQAINLVGLALGQLLVDRFGLEWVALTDEHGTEAAVRGPSNLTVFPANFVAKRYETGETNFIAPFVHEVAQKLDQSG